MTQKIEQSQRQERVAAWNRRAECDLAAFQNSPKQTYQAEKARDRKLCANLEEAIRRSGLQDGMTVSFHHAFRGGDLTVNMVMDVIAKMVGGGLLAAPIREQRYRVHELLHFRTDIRWGRRDCEGGPNSYEGRWAWGQDINGGCLCRL